MEQRWMRCRETGERGRGVRCSIAGDLEDEATEWEVRCFRHV